MAFIYSKVIILFIWACFSTLSSANVGRFRGYNSTLNRSPPPPLRRFPPSPPPSRRPPTPPSRRFPPPPSHHPRTPPSRQFPPPPPSRRPRTPPSQWLPPPPRHPRTPPSPRHPRTPPLVLSSPPPPSRRCRTPPQQSPPPSPPSQQPQTPPSPMMSPPPRSRRPRTPPSQKIPPPPPSVPSPSPLPSLPPSPSPLPIPQSPRKIIVGGSKQWQLGFDYNDWALKNGPFYVNDILVFKYDPPNTSTPPHSVYQLPNMRSFANCDLGKGKMVANITQGSRDGFEFVLKDQNPYYFACGEGNGFHCKLGSMKFTLTPIVKG